MVDEDVCAVLGVMISPAWPDSPAAEEVAVELDAAWPPCVNTLASSDGNAPMVSLEMAPPARLSRVCLLPKGPLPRCR